MQIALAASDADGNALDAAHRLAAGARHRGPHRHDRDLLPRAGFAGTDPFTFAAWDGSTDSNLGTVRLSVTAAPPLAGPHRHLEDAADADLHRDGGVLRCSVRAGS